MGSQITAPESFDKKTNLQLLLLYDVTVYDQCRQLNLKRERNTWNICLKLFKHHGPRKLNLHPVLKSDGKHLISSNNTSCRNSSAKCDEFSQE